MLSFQSNFDRLVGIPTNDAVLRSDLLDTTMLRPSGFIMASLGFLLMSGAAAWMTHATWAVGWFLVDGALIVTRLALALPSWRSRSRMADGSARAILIAAFAMFAIFGLGCSVSFLSGARELQISSIIASMGLLAGVATRWAALPRLAVGTTIVISLPIAIAVATLSAFAVTLFVVLAIGTALLAMQNNRTLRALLAAERMARYLSQTDALTGVLNRTGLANELTLINPRQAALLYLDLDDFKLVNDTFGHATGDLVLKEVGLRLREAAGTQLVSRLGGDEFVVVLSSADPAAATKLAQEICDKVRRPIWQPGFDEPIRISTSYGIAVGSPAATGASALLAEADVALYAAKRSRSDQSRRTKAAPGSLPRAA